MTIAQTFTLGLLVTASVAGCAAPGNAGTATAPRPTPAPEPVAMVIGNQAVPWNEIRPRLTEAAGAQVVEETILDHLLRAELERAAITLDPASIEHERELFARTLRRAVPSDEQPPTEQLLARVRRARGLGPERFEAMLRRNAMLRRLVAPTVQVSEEDVRQSLDVRFGPRVRCRLIVVGVEADAVRVRERLAAAPPDELAAHFAGEAALVSIDPSGARGGEIEPISPADPNYAMSFRRALADLQPGVLSPVLVFDRGYALALGVERIPGTTPPPEAEAAARDDVRQRLERTDMDRLAARLVSTAPLTVLDPGLNWSWTNRGAR